MAESVFYDIADTPNEAANLTARSLLMIAIEQRIREQGWTQAQAARALSVRQPRVSDLMNGKIDKFSLDALVNMLPGVGLTITIKPAPTQTPANRRLVGAELPRRQGRRRSAAATGGRGQAAAAASGNRKLAAAAKASVKAAPASRKK